MLRGDVFLEEHGCLCGQVDRDEFAGRVGGRAGAREATGGIAHD